MIVIMAILEKNCSKSTIVLMNLCLNCKIKIVKVTLRLPVITIGVACLGIGPGDWQQMSNLLCNTCGQVTVYPEVPV